MDNGMVLVMSSQNAVMFVKTLCQVGEKSVLIGKLVSENSEETSCVRDLLEKSH